MTIRRAAEPPSARLEGPETPTRIARSLKGSPIRVALASCQELGAVSQRPAHHSLETAPPLGTATRRCAVEVRPARGRAGSEGLATGARSSAGQRGRVPAEYRRLATGAPFREHRLLICADLLQSDFVCYFCHPVTGLTPGTPSVANGPGSARGHSVIMQPLRKSICGRVDVYSVLLDLERLIILMVNALLRTLIHVPIEPMG